jgi:hypothetical protein
MEAEKNNKALARGFLQNLMYQDRLDNEEEQKLVIHKIKDYLGEVINFYQDIYSFDEEDEFLSDILNKPLGNKKEILYSLEKTYLSKIEILKTLGADVAEYPNKLEDLVE